MQIMSADSGDSTKAFAEPAGAEVRGHCDMRKSFARDVSEVTFEEADHPYPKRTNHKCPAENDENPASPNVAFIEFWAGLSTMSAASV